MVPCSPDATEASMQLTDTQLVVLSAALAREDGLVLPLPTTLKGGAVAKVCSALLAKSLAEEVALSRKEAQAAPEKVFRTAEDEKPMTLRITALGARRLMATPRSRLPRPRRLPRKSRPAVPRKRRPTRHSPLPRPPE